MNRTPVHEFLDEIEPYDLYEIGVLAESNPALAKTADEHGFFPVHKAAWVGDAELATRLLDLGARVDARDPGGNTALHLAAFRGHMAVVRLLVARGADVDSMDAAGHTPLFASVHDGNEAIAILLLSCGSRFGYAEGGQLLLAATERNLSGLVEALLDAGARPSSDSSNRATSR